MEDRGVHRIRRNGVKWMEGGEGDGACPVTEDKDPSDLPLQDRAP